MMSNARLTEQRRIGNDLEGNDSSLIGDNDELEMIWKETTVA